MLSILAGGVTLAVLAVLGYFNPGDMLHTIGAGAEKSFASAGWVNPFQNTSLIGLADANIALFADHILPAVIPGSTGTGRPYLVSFSDPANLTIANETVNIPEPVAHIYVLRESMTAQIIWGAVLFLLTACFLAGVVTLVHWSDSARLETLRDAMSQNAPALGFLERLCNITNANELETIREPLGQLSEEMHTAGRTPYLPILTTHIDFVLNTIDSADDRYKASVETEKLLADKKAELELTIFYYNVQLLVGADLREKLQQKIDELEQFAAAQEEQLGTTIAKCDKLLIDTDILRQQLGQRKEQLERHESEAKKYETDRKDLRAKADDYNTLNGRVSNLETELRKSYVRNNSLNQSLMGKTQEHKAVVNQLEQANTKCDGLEATLTNVKGDLKGVSDRCGQLEAKLKAANDRWDTFSRGPSDIEDASGTSLPAAIDGELDGLPGDATSLHNPDQPSGSAIAPSSPVLARLDSQFPAHVSRPSPAMTRRYSMGSAQAASGFAAADFVSFAARPLAGNLGSGTFSSMNGTSGSSQHAPLAPKPDSSSDRNGVANKVNPDGQTDQSSPSVSVSKPPATAGNGPTSPQSDTASSPVPQSPSEGSKAGSHDGMDTKPTPTPTGVPPAEGTPDSPPTSTSAPQGPDSSTPEPPQPRGRSPTRSNAPSTGIRSSTPASCLGDRPPTPPPATPADRSRGSPIRENAGCVFEARRKRSADAKNGLRDAPTHQSGFPSPPGSGRGSAPYRGGRDSRGRGGNDEKPEQSDYMKNLLGGKGGKAPGKGPASGKPPRGRLGNQKQEGPQIPDWLQKRNGGEKPGPASTED
ncbi:MAG: hypothetical protein Q9226_004339 [Calogaya cf. arnoldii]